MAKTLAELELCIPAIDDIQSRLLLGGTGYWEKTIELPEVPVSPQPERPDDPELPNDIDDPDDPYQDRDDDHEGDDPNHGDSSPDPQSTVNGFNEQLPAFLSELLGKITVQFGSLDGKSAQYDAKNDILTLDPSQGLTFESYLHELIHAWQDSQGHMDGATHASIEFETYILMDIWSMYERDGRGYDMGFTEGGNELKEFLYECTHGGDLSQPFDWDYF